MIPEDDWARWGQDWRRQPAVDAKHLQRLVHRKLWQIRVVLFAEGLTALFAFVQVMRLQFLPEVTLRWKVWGAAALLLLAVVTYASIRVRRGTWRAATDTIPDLLGLTVKRARAGIRVAWINILSVPTLVAVSLPFAIPWLAPSRWRHDPALQHILILNIGANGAILVGGLVLCVFYIRRQRRQLRKAEALLREYRDLKPG